MMRFLKPSATNSDVEQSDSQSTSSEEVITYTYEELKMSMEEAQKKHFGYKNLKDFQVEAVQATFNKKNSFLVMATGMGKSLCYQIPSIMKEAKKKFTIVISPLISLMKDQVDNLNRKNISAVYLGSGQKGNTNTILTQIKHGVYNMIYCSPEYALNNKNLFSMLKKRILLIAIDEVHCMSEWGHDFRPAYRKLNELKKIVAGIPIMCLTATCTKNVQDDILKTLQFDLNTCLIKRSSVNKRNLFYSVRIKTDLYKDLKDILDIPQKATTTRTKHFVDNSKICPYNSTLIYVNSKKECEEIHDFLKSKGLLVGMYHADMSHGDKLASHEQFLKDEIQIVVATVAFGMGIDKPDIRRIIHYGFSRSLEGYVQQVGRAGRDNGDAEAILFFNMVDESKTKNIIIRENMANQQMVKNFERVQHIINMFTDASDYAYSSICRRKKIYEYFDEEPKETDDTHIFDDENNKGVCFYVREWDTYICAKCDNCVNYMNIMKHKKRKENLPNTKLNKLEKLEDSIKFEDLSNELLSLLKCISALNGRTGSSTIQKILIKSKESAIVKKKYHELDVYGHGSHKSAQWWSAFMKIVRNDKYIQETLNFGNDIGYVSIGLTEKGENFIKEKGGKYMVSIPTCLMGLLGQTEKAKGSVKKKEMEKEKQRFHFMENVTDTKAADDTFSQNKKEPTNFADFSFTKTSGYGEFNKQEQTSFLSTSRNDSTNGINVNELKVQKANKENKEAIDKYRYFNADKNEITKKEETVKKLTNSEINDKIMSILLRTRMLEARKQNIPPFQLISDQPLKDICHMRLSTVKLIRKHVDNISPICPNSFLEKLVQGIRGFCLLYEIETDVNIKEYSQTNFGASLTPTVKESSVNKFDSLISAFSYGNTNKEEHFTNAPPSSNIHNKNLKTFKQDDHSNKYTQDLTRANNAVYMNHDTTTHASNYNANRNSTYANTYGTSHANSRQCGYIPEGSYNQANYTSSAGREVASSLHKEPIKCTAIDFSNFMFKPKDAENGTSELPVNEDGRSNNNLHSFNSERNCTNNNQRNYNSTTDSGNNRHGQNCMSENRIHNDSFQRPVIHNIDNHEMRKRNFTSATNVENVLHEPVSVTHHTNSQQIRVNNLNSNDTKYNSNTTNRNNFVPPVDMFSPTPRDYSEINNFDTNDDDFFNSFSTKPIAESEGEQLREKKKNLSFFDNFAYDKNKLGNNETDIFGHSSNLSNVTFRELKKRKKF